MQCKSVFKDFENIHLFFLLIRILKNISENVGSHFSPSNTAVSPRTFTQIWKKIKIDLSGS